MRSTPLLWVLAALLAGAPQASAQKLQEGPAPLEMTVSPPLLAPGRALEISGLSVPTPKDGPVRITIRGPLAGRDARSAPVVATLAAPVGKDGRFSIRHTAPAVSGSYLVEGVAPDGKGKASATFTAASPAALAEAAGKAVQAVVATSDLGLGRTLSMLAEMPPSPAREDARAKGTAAKAKVAQLAAEAPKIQQALSQAFAVMERFPATAPAFDGLLDQVAEATEDLSEQEERIRQRIEATRTLTLLCDDLDVVYEVTVALAACLNSVGKWTDVLKNWMLDKGVLAGINRLPNSEVLTLEDKFAATTGVKAAAAVLGGPAGIASYAFGAVTDYVGYLSASLFAQYCEKIEGPISGTFHCEFEHEGRTWWTHDVKLDGKISLRYGKAGGRATSVTGHIEGNARFALKENALILFPSQKRALFAHLSIPPVGARYVEDAGMFARMATPGYFRVPVEGTIVGDKLSLEIKPATNDFSDLIRGRAYYIFVEAITLVPHVAEIVYPVQKAHFILSRGLRGTPEFDLVVDRAGKRTTIEKQFDRDWTSDDRTAHVRWRIHVKGCNPSCAASVVAPPS